MRTELVRRDAREVGWAYLLWFSWFLGICGIHRFYTGRWITGLLWLCTGGLCGIGQIVDLIFIPRMVEDHNAGRPVW